MSVFQPNGRSYSKFTGRRVYFLRCVGFPAIKIGCSFQTERRLTAIQCNMPFDMEFISEFPGTGLDERYLHVLFLRHRLGGEFFRDCDEIREWYEHAAEFGAPLHPLPELATLARVRGQDIAAFCERHGISSDAISDLLDVGPKTRRKYEKQNHGGSSAYLAAVAVLAKRAGADVSEIWDKPRAADAVIDHLALNHPNTAHGRQWATPTASAGRAG